MNTSIEEPLNVTPT